MPIYTDIDYKLNTKNKDLKLSEDAEAINNSIRNILLTQKYTVPGNPDFGADLEKVLFEQMDGITMQLIKDIIINEIEKWEPRIVINEILFKKYEQYQRLSVTLKYTILKSNEMETVSLKLGE